LQPNLSASADLKAFRHFATSTINRFVGLFHIVIFSFACSFKLRQSLFRPIGKLRTLTGLQPNLSASADLKAFRLFATSVVNRFVGLFHIVRICLFRRFQTLNISENLEGLKAGSYKFDHSSMPSISNF
jgi:hypothetical protein